ncbi:SCO family protein [Chitinimonas lacunae]|uniref:SCO family protein n=1 Tax=Chitinimonas lacunae TaxID=1963018 RepID=A0ABV8MMS5_9NEIS
MSVFLWPRRSLGTLFLALMLAACGDNGQVSGSSGAAPTPFQSTDITGAPIGSDPAQGSASSPFLTLTDHHGKPRSLADFRGKVVVLFFGYTHCPDVCPTTMSELASAMKQLGPQAREVQVLFVSVDPERDPPELLARYVPAFDPSFIGLTGSPAEVKSVADRFKIVYQKVNGSDEKNYTVDHSAGSYIFDKTGKLRLFVSYGAGAKVFAHDIGLLLKS